MMSAALLMLAGVEQTGKPAGPTDLSVDLSVDQGELEGISFAKSFSDRVGESVSLQAKSSTKEAPIRLLSDSKAAVLTKKLDAAAVIPGEGKGVARAVQEAVVLGKVKNAASLPGAAPETDEPGLGAKAAVNDTAAKTVVPGASVREGETTDDASSSSSTSSAVPVALQPNDHVVLPESSIEEGRPVVSSAGSAFFKKETEGAGKTKEIDSVRKTAKMPENPATSKTVRNTVEASENVNSSKPAESALKEDSGTAFTQGIVIGLTVPAKKDVRPTGNSVSQAISGATAASSGVPSVVTVAAIHKQTGHEAKAGALDTETAMTSADGQPALAKFGGELEKAATTVAATGSGSDSKMQSASGPGMLMAHPAAGGVASGVAALTVVSGSATGEPVPMKPQIGEAGAHTAGLTLGSREQDTLGSVAATDSIPTMLKATPTALEVGIQDGTHGWLKVRAEMADGGVVNASVSAASSTGQEMLHRELPAITAYLQQEKVVVNAIAVHTPLAAGTEQRSSTGMDGAGGQTRQGGHEGGEPQQNIRKGLPAGPDERPTYQSLQRVDEDGSLPLAAYASGGSWLSVRA